MFANKYVALQWRLKKRRELIAKLERTLREIKQLEHEIELFHGHDVNTSEKVNEALYEPQTAQT